MSLALKCDEIKFKIDVPNSHCGLEEELDLSGLGGGFSRVIFK